MCRIFYIISGQTPFVMLQMKRIQTLYCAICWCEMFDVVRCSLQRIVSCLCCVCMLCCCVALTIKSQYWLAAYDRRACQRAVRALVDVGGLHGNHRRKWAQPRYTIEATDATQYATAAAVVWSLRLKWMLNAMHHSVSGYLKSHSACWYFVCTYRNTMAQT